MKLNRGDIITGIGHGIEGVVVLIMEPGDEERCGHYVVLASDDRGADYGWKAGDTSGDDPVPTRFYYFAPSVWRIIPITEVL